MTTFRLATPGDIPAIAAIYELILDTPHKNACANWRKGIYPTEATAILGVELGDMYVECDDTGRVLAAARINHEQDEFYAEAEWLWTADAPADQILVIHTLVVDHSLNVKGAGTNFIDFYESEAIRRGCPNLRIDTNETNLPARALYKKLGFREVSLAIGSFHGIDDLHLITLEKRL